MPDEVRYFGFKNWKKYQHYKNRRPPWIKLYGSLLHDRDFQALSEVDRGRMMGLLILASEHDNRIIADTSWLYRELNCRSAVSLTRLFASNMLAWSCGSVEQNASAEREGERERETEGETDPPIPPIKKPRKSRLAEDPPSLEFEQFWEAFPRRPGDPKYAAWKAWKRLLAQNGTTPTDLIRSAGNYRKHMDTTGKAGTSYQQQGATFLGPEKQTWREYLLAVIEASGQPKDTLSPEERLKIQQMWGPKGKT